MVFGNFNIPRNAILLCGLRAFIHYHNNLVRADFRRSGTVTQDFCRVNVAQLCIWLRMHEGREALQGLLNIFELVLVSNYTCRVLLDLREAVVEEANINDFTFEILACQTGMVDNLDLVVNDSDMSQETNV